MPRSIFVAIAAGAASAVMFASVASCAAAGVFLTLVFAPLPLAIAGFGWGWTTALAGAAIASLGLAAIVNFAGVIMYAIAIALPIVGFTYLASLNRDLTADDGSVWVQWYPIGYVLAAIAAWAGLLSAASTYAIGGDLEAITAAIRQTIERVFSSGTDNLPPNMQRPLTPDEMDRLADLVARMTPGATSIGWMMIAMFNLWLGAALAGRANSAGRPWPDFSGLILPKTFPLWFALATGLSFIEGFIGLVASGFAWAFFVVYMLVGIAIVHQLTRGQSLRFAALIATWLAVIFLQPLSGMALALAGLAEPLWPLKRKSLEDTPVPRGPPPRNPPPGPD